MTERLLVVDAGNTNIVAGVYDGRELITSWRVSTSREQTADECRLQFQALFASDGLDPASVDAAVLASVVPPLTETLRAGLQRLFGVAPLVVRPGIRTGTRLLYDHPEEIGADRIANSIAAYERVEGAAIVVDFGTSTNFDCVSGAGEFLGGVLAPGLGISAEALFRSAARLPRVEVSRPDRVIGKTTVSAMQSGLFFGYCGLVDGILDHLLEEMTGEPRVLATGGMAKLIASGSRHSMETVPNLTLDGLRLLHERNR